MDHKGERRRSRGLRRAIHVMLLALTALAPAVPAAEAPSFPAGAGEAEARVLVDGRPLFSVRAGIGPLSAAERAEQINGRLRRLAGDLENDAGEVRAVALKDSYVIALGDTRILSVTPEDAALEPAGLPDLAARWRDEIARALIRAHKERSRRHLLIGAGLTLVYLAGFAAVVFVLRLFGRAASRWIEAQRGRRIRPVRIRNVELLSEQALRGLLERTVRTLSILVFLGSLYLALVLSLARFPQTYATGEAMLQLIIDPVVRILRGVVEYLPSLITILVIVAITRGVLRLVRGLFVRIQSGDLSLEPYVHRDTAQATFQIVRAAIVVFSLFFIAPLLPGTGTRAAQGITLLLGLMISLGSTSTVGNFIAGIVLIYMRPFQIGDRVKLGEVQGDVVSRGFLQSRIRTIKNEDIIVPSLGILGGHIVNYSARARAEGLILHTSVTIGYDTPWRTVRDLLVRAAERTSGILDEPAPFVLITSLGDFYVTYEINAATDRPREMARLYSDLHANIQDAFNEAGVEIMSAHYLHLRDGNRRAVPVEHLPRGYEAPRHRVEVRRDGEAVPQPE